MVAEGLNRKAGFERLAGQRDGARSARHRAGLPGARIRPFGLTLLQPSILAEPLRGINPAAISSCLINPKTGRGLRGRVADEAERAAARLRDECEEVTARVLALLETARAALAASDVPLEAVRETLSAVEGEIGR